MEAECNRPIVIPIDRSKPFNVVALLGKSWRIDEEDERSLVLTDIDLAQVRLETMMRDGELRIVGEEKLRRLKAAGHVRLDAKILQALLEKPHLVPEHIKTRMGSNMVYVFFDGTVLLNPDGNRCILYLACLGGQWKHWSYHWLDYGWRSNNPSLVLSAV